MSNVGRVSSAITTATSTRPSATASMAERSVIKEVKPPFSTEHRPFVVNPRYSAAWAANIIQGSPLMAPGVTNRPLTSDGSMAASSSACRVTVAHRSSIGLSKSRVTGVAPTPAMARDMVSSPAAGRGSARRCS